MGEGSVSSQRVVQVVLCVGARTGEWANANALLGDASAGRGPDSAVRNEKRQEHTRRPTGAETQYSYSGTAADSCPAAGTTTRPGAKSPLGRKTKATGQTSRRASEQASRREAKRRRQGKAKGRTGYSLSSVRRRRPARSTCHLPRCHTETTILRPAWLRPGIRGRLAVLATPTRQPDFCCWKLKKKEKKMKKEEKSENTAAGRLGSTCPWAKRNQSSLAVRSSARKQRRTASTVQNRPWPCGTTPRRERAGFVLHLSLLSELGVPFLSSPVRALSRAAGQSSCVSRPAFVGRLVL